MNLRLGAILLLAATVVPAAPAAAKAGGSAKTLYSRALERERVVREADGRATLQQLRGLVDTYEAIARRFPASGYTDNALWQGGNVALLAFERFGQPADRRSAERLLNQLKRGYPSSSLVSRVDDALGHGSDTSRTVAPMRPQKPLARLPVRAFFPVALTPSIGSRPADGDGVPNSPVPTAGVSQAGLAVEPATVVPGQGPVAIRDIKRTSIDGGMRVTIEMDGEASYRAEQLERPRRVFFDLKDTRPISMLQDATLKFTDEIVREVRLGRHPRNTTRIVFDMEGVDSYSVFTLYNPFRMVIDFKAGAPGNRTGPTRSAEASPKPPIAELPRLPLVSSLPAPTLSAPVATKVSREMPELVTKPLASRPVSSTTPIPPGVPSATPTAGSPCPGNSAWAYHAWSSTPGMAATTRAPSRPASPSRS